MSDSLQQQLNFAVPCLDRKASNGQANKPFTIAGACVLFYFVAMIVLAYMS